jgi:hypothetical protein
MRYPATYAGARHASPPNAPCDMLRATCDMPRFEDAPYRVLIARLSPLRDVDRSLTAPFSLPRGPPGPAGAYVDMAFFPPGGAQDSRHPLTGICSRRPARDFDLILVSNAYILELLNLPTSCSAPGFPSSPENAGKMTRSSSWAAPTPWPRRPSSGRTATRWPTASSSGKGRGGSGKSSGRWRGRTAGGGNGWRPRPPRAPASGSPEPVAGPSGRSAGPGRRTCPPSTPP